MAERNVLDRRTFVKGMLAAGATVTVAACAPVATPGAPAPAAPVAPPTVTGPAWIHPKSLVRAQPGYGGAHLTWKYGDTVKWLPPEKYPADAAADALARVPKAKLELCYYYTYLGRIWETTFRDIVLAGKDYVAPAVHSGGGEEAMGAAIPILALNPDDYWKAHHRWHGGDMAKGKTTLAEATTKSITVRDMTTHFMNKVQEPTKAYGGFHIVDPKVGHLGIVGLIGLGPALACGAAWACKVQKKGRIVGCFEGDGAQMGLYMFVNVRSATNYKLPIFFGIDNNFQNMSMPVATITPSPYLADFTTGLGIPTTVVDGNSVAAVYYACKEAADRARAGDGPSMVEMLTWRHYDHAGWAGAKIGVDGAFGLPYRTDDEVRAWLGRDSVERYGTFLKDRGLFTQAELDALKAKARADMDDSVDFARKGTYARPEDGCKGTWFGGGTQPATQFFEHAVIE